MRVTLPGNDAYPDIVLDTENMTLTATVGTVPFQGSIDEVVNLIAVIDAALTDKERHNQTLTHLIDTDQGFTPEYARVYHAWQEASERSASASDRINVIEAELSNVIAAILLSNASAITDAIDPATQNAAEKFLLHGTEGIREYASYVANTIINMLLNK